MPGATGTIVRAHPHITVLVHERGAKHMIDPSRLLDSAARLYGNQMDRLWGEFASVPQTNMSRHRRRRTASTRAGGFRRRLHAGPRVPSRELLRRLSPASRSSVMSRGSVLGGYVLPPTPPPDIDLEGWRTSADRILAWSPATLFLTHFGPVTPVRPHLSELLDNLAMIAAIVRESLDGPGDRRREESSVLRSGFDRSCGGIWPMPRSMLTSWRRVQVSVVRTGAILAKAAGLRGLRQRVNGTISSPPPAAWRSRAASSALCSTSSRNA